MNKTLLYTIFVTLAVLLGLTSCIDDSFTTSPSDQPRFSVDTLQMGLVFTDQMTTTHRFTVHNPASKALSIDNISLVGENARYFRLNVDGFSGDRFTNVEIRAKDSIFVFVEATLPENNLDLPVEILANVEFQTNSVKKSVVVSAFGQDVIRLHACRIDDNQSFRAGRPYLIYDSLVVEKGATLRLEPGARLMFHDKAAMAVYGTLISEGTPEAFVTLSGDRSGNVVSDISFDLMSRQWQGLWFYPGSEGLLSHTTVKNTESGVVVDGEGAEIGQTKLQIHNSRLRNSGGTVLAVFHADVVASGSEFAEGGGGLVWLEGGKQRFDQCTFANYYLFSALGGPALGFGHLNSESDDESGLPYTVADITNSIIYGLGADVSPGDLTGSEVFIRNCLIKSAGSDDENFLNCLWDVDPLYYTVRNDYYFDYRLRDDSPAIAAANHELNLQQSATDAYGLSRGELPDLGAYVYQPSSDDSLR